jgi:hypothetical protein
MVTIQEVLRDRGDLSTFVVHLTRGEDPYESLESILTNWTIEARSCFGPIPSRRLVEQHPGTALEGSQRVVCFTETPLRFVHLMCADIEHRNFNFAPYGIAFTRTYARTMGVNPVWYIDTTQPRGDYRRWLINPVWQMINDAATLAGQGAVSADELAALPIFDLTPFIETMGRMGQKASRKEFWWEREWRKVGNFTFSPSKAVVVLAPEENHETLRKAVQHIPGYNGMRPVDVTWKPDRIEQALDGLDNEPFPS